MDLELWLLILAVVAVLNYVAGRSGKSWIGRVVFLATSLPPLALTLYVGAHLAFAILYAEEVNARFQEGDLTFFGAGTAFAASLGVFGLWVFVSFSALKFGRAQARHATRE